MGEFQLIRDIFLPLAGQTRSAAVLLGPGDDCAIQRLAPGSELVFSVDTLVEGVHFPVGYDPEKLGWRALAVAVSDLAAMGASPECFTLALTLPDSDEAWLRAFASGLGRAARRFGLALAGGDTTRGPLTLSIQVHGSVPESQALLRSGARAGDLICVSGTLGDAGAALDYLDQLPAPAEAEPLLERYHHPQPRLELGQQLRSVATAAIDVSDGLLADLGHILAASGLGATVDVALVPLSAALRHLGDRAIPLALTAGDDYELCVTLPPGRWAALPSQVRSQLTVIGATVPEPGLKLQNAPPGLQAGLVVGYDHFGASS